jgi:hypothetical protein
VYVNALILSPFRTLLNQVRSRVNSSLDGLLSGKTAKRDQTLR